MNLGEMIDKELREMREEMESLRRRVRELEGSSAAPMAYTVEGAAEALSTNASNVRALIRSGAIPHFTLEKNKQRYWIHRADLEEYIRRRKMEA